MNNALTREETQEFLSQYYNGASNERFEQMMRECKRSVIQSIVVPFGLGKIVAAYDNMGGNVDTVHNVRNEVWIDKNEMVSFEKHDKSYNHKAVHKEDGNYGDMKRKAQAIKEGFLTARDSYTGAEMNAVNASVTFVGKNGGKYKPNSPSRDHIIAARIIWGDAGVHLAEIDPNILINLPDNLVFTTNFINSFKNDLTVPEFLAQVPQKIHELETKIQKMNKQLENATNDEDRNKIENAINKQREHVSQLKRVDKNKENIQKDYERVNKLIESKINKSYYTSKKFIMNTTQTSAIEGVKMGTQQVLGLVMVEFFTAFFEETSDMYHKGFFVDEKGFFETLKIRLQNIATKVKRYITEKYKDIAAAFGGGFISGMLSNLVTVAINIFATTSARLVRIIREGIFSFLRAVKLVVFPPKGLSQEEIWHEVKKLIVGALIVGLGILVEQGVETFLNSLGLIAISGLMTSIFVGALSGIALAIAMYWLDTNHESVEKMRYEEIRQLCVENLPAFVNEREELTQLIEATHRQRFMSLESSFADYQSADINYDDDGIYEALCEINAMWEKELTIKTNEDVQARLNSGTGILYFNELEKTMIEKYNPRHS